MSLLRFLPLQEPAVTFDQNPIPNSRRKQATIIETNLSALQSMLLQPREGLIVSSQKLEKTRKTQSKLEEARKNQGFLERKAARKTKELEKTKDF